MSEHDEVSNKGSIKMFVNILNDTGPTKINEEERYTASADINKY